MLTTPRRVSESTLVHIASVWHLPLGALYESLKRPASAAHFKHSLRLLLISGHCENGKKPLFLINTIEQPIVSASTTGRIMSYMIHLSMRSAHSYDVYKQDFLFDGFLRTFMHNIRECDNAIARASYSFMPGFDCI